MRAGQKMTAKDGTEVVLFPLEVMNISQGENGQYSHMQTYNIDFVGTTSKAPIYAPCTLKCIDEWDYSGSHNLTYQSCNANGTLTQVLFADGHKDILTIDFAHDENPIHRIGAIIPQGDLLGHTGMYGNVTGDHTHSCCGAGIFRGYIERYTGCYDLVNRVHYYNACFINDTTIINDLGYPWKTYEGGIVPPTPPFKGKKRKNFPWVLYAEKLRNG